MSAKFVCRLPDPVSFEIGAALMLKGLTAQYLLKRTQPQGGRKCGDFVLFHAIADGVGLIAAQWAKALGLQLIGTARSEEKCELARECGASYVIKGHVGQVARCLSTFVLMVSSATPPGPCRHYHLRFLWQRARSTSPARRCSRISARTK